MTGQHNALPTLQDIRSAHSSRKRDYEKYLPISRFCFRPLGFLLTWLAIRLQLATETVSFLSGVVGITGCLFLTSDKENLLPLGLALLILFNLLDCVDGSIARTMKTENPYGRFLDAFCGAIIDIAFWPIIGIMAYRHDYLLTYPKVFGHSSYFWLAVGAVNCYLTFLILYVETTFDKLLRHDWDQLRLRKINKTPPHSQNPQKDNLIPSSNETNIRQFLTILNNNFRARETHYFLLILGFIIHIIDIFLIIFFIYYIINILLLLITYINRGRMIRQLY